MPESNFRLFGGPESDPKPVVIAGKQFISRVALGVTDLEFLRLAA